MPTSFYDVTVIGTELGSLVAAALLARRGFRVLVVGQDAIPSTYAYGDLRLPRAPTTLAALDSPAFRRVFSELALSQVVKRRAKNPATSFQVVLPRHRIDFVADPDIFAAEINREFPDAARSIEAFYANLARVNAELDRLIEKDIVWPPDSFFERREFARAALNNPFADGRGEKDLFADFPLGHLFRTVITAQSRLGTRLDPDRITPFELARIHGAWMRGGALLEGEGAGLDVLYELLIDKIGSHSGEVRLNDRVDQIVVRRGRIAGIRIGGHEEPFGSTFVVHGGDARALLDLTDDKDLARRLTTRLDAARPKFFRYTLNVVIAAEGYPEGMARTVFAVRDPSFPLAEENVVEIDSPPPDAAGRRVLSVATLVPADLADAGPQALLAMRSRVLETLRWIVPFLDRHLLVVDSPHDGAPVDDRRPTTAAGATTGGQTGPSLSTEERWRRTPKAMEPVWGPLADSALGVTGLSTRLGVKNLLSAGSQVVPGLGVEGLFLAGWTAARIITRTDRKKERMRRELWAKMEI